MCFVVFPLILFTTKSVLSVVVFGCAGYAGTIGVLNSMRSGIPELQLNDLFTLFLTGVCAAAIFINVDRLRRSWVLADSLFILFVGWAVVRTFGAPSRFDAAKDIVFLLLFLAACNVTRMYVREGTDLSTRVAQYVVWGACVAILLLGLFAAMGFVAWTPTGLMSPLGKRPLALFLMVVLSASLSMWVYPSSGSIKSQGLIFSLLSIALIVLTLSRMVLGVLLVVHLPVAFVLRKTRRLTSLPGMAKIPLYIVGAVLLVLLLFSESETARHRFFFQINSHNYHDLFYWENFNTMGRANVWPEIWRHCRMSPWVGHGTGSVRSYSRMLCGWDHPHCDYLRVLHDQGLVGFVLFTSFWLLKVARLWKLRRDSTSRHVQQAVLAAVTATAGVVISFVTDNTIVYTYAMLPLALLIGAAEAQSEIAEEPAALTQP